MNPHVSAPPSAGPAQLTIQQYESLKPAAELTIAGKRLVYLTPNAQTIGRVQSLMTKEPVTIAWLNEMRPGEILFDIGANVGMYTIYAAVMREVTVHAFEPESQNFALLNRNIAENGLDGRVTAYPVAISDANGLDTLFLSMLRTGASCHSFGAEVGFDLAARPSAFRQGAISVSLDEAVRAGSVPVPDHVKIDVDGFEHLVLEGMRETLADTKVKTLLVELNGNLPEHRAAFAKLAELGFTFDEGQMQAALRTSGPFTGVGEVVFRRTGAPVAVEKAEQAASTFLKTGGRHEEQLFHRPLNFIIPKEFSTREALRHVLAKVNEAPISNDPFPHVVIDGIFPDWYYEAIQENFPDDKAFIPLNETGRTTGDAYKERLCILFDRPSFARIPPFEREFWKDFGSLLYSDLFITAFIAKFSEALDGRLQSICGDGSPLSVRSDALLIRDQTNYRIGPHTDSPFRLVTFVFYLPKDEGHKDCGTSFYRPKDPNFTCWGGPHYDFADFERVGTLDFLPNRLLAFAKSEHSFHGVEPLAREGVDRRLLINNIRVLNEVKY